LQSWLGFLCLREQRALVLKFTSVSGSVRAITDIIRTRITTDLIIIFLITARTTGTVGIAIIAIVIPIITGASLIGIATPGLARNISEPA
jgi:hypothetical protein